jgi:hypothetical protein
MRLNEDFAGIALGALNLDHIATELKSFGKGWEADIFLLDRQERLQGGPLERQGVVPLASDEDQAAGVADARAIEHQAFELFEPGQMPFSRTSNGNRLRRASPVGVMRAVLKRDSQASTRCMPRLQKPAPAAVEWQRRSQMATLVRWEPFRELASLHNEMSRLMNAFDRAIPPAPLDPAS